MMRASQADEEQAQLEIAAAAELVASRSRERYWSALYAPSVKRPALLALYAFNAELEHIAAAVREPMVAQIRLQWWRDAIELAAPGMKTGNPVADALSAQMLALDLPRDRLMAMIEARVPGVAGDSPANMQDLRSTLRQAEGTVFELAAWILGECGEAEKHAAAQAGVAWGLTQRLRMFPVHASQRRLQLPPTAFESRGVDLAWVYTGKSSAGLMAALSDLREEAGRELQRFRELPAKPARAAWPAFLPLALVPPYLKAMAAPSFDPLKTVATTNPLGQFWRIWGAAWRRAV